MTWTHRRFLATTAAATAVSLAPDDKRVGGRAVAAVHAGLIGIVVAPGIEHVEMRLPRRRPEYRRRV